MEESEGDEASRRLQESLGSDPDNPLHHLELGQLLWKKGEEEFEEEESKVLKGRAVEHFVISAKLDPRNGVAFRYLGHYYRLVSVDTQRASKCYLRAVALDPNDFEAGEGLCEVLDDQGKESLEISVCKEASTKSPRAFWAFRRLGYLQVHQKKWSEAVQSLQHAIRGYPACADLWEALALAYQHLGMLTAALKSYERVIELKNTKVFALVQSGFILLMLGSFSKAIEHFRSAVDLSPKKVASYFGLASGLLELSRKCLSSGAFSWGVALLEEASSIASECTKLDANCSSSWKLLGDIQIAHARCFPWGNRSNDIKIDGLVFETSIHDWKRIRLSSAVNAKYSYERVLHLTPWQAKSYTDLAISLDLLKSLEEKDELDVSIWSLPGKMSLGGLMFEGGNSDIWLALGCFSNNNVLKQHALIRALQLDVSFAVGWAHLGKFYRSLAKMDLAKKAFDHARSIDPSLALPWAGISSCLETSTSHNVIEEAYESCLRAVQIFPFADFQAGLGTLATLSGHLLTPQVFVAVKQAVQLLPIYPESHNLVGLVYEARLDFHSAIAAYKRAKCALNIMPMPDLETKAADVSINLARTFCLAGYALDAAIQCEELKKKDLLDDKGRQVYIVSLFQLGKNDMALAETKHLASNVSRMGESSRAATLAIICKLLYCIKGLDSTISTIVKFPRNYFQSTKVTILVHAINVLGSSSVLQLLLPYCNATLTCEEIGELHYLVSLDKMLSVTEEEDMKLDSAGYHLKKVLHMYPNNNAIRIQLGSLQLCSKQWKSSHIALRCPVIPDGRSTSHFSKSPYEILGSASVACFACCTSKQRYSFSTCGDHSSAGTSVLHQMQKWLHREPWNIKAHYLLVLNIFQNAREQNFPRHICVSLKRMVLTCLSNSKHQFYDYQEFQLLLSISEICLQSGDYDGCISHAISASKLLVSQSSLFFSYLQMCRAYALMGDLKNLINKCMYCLQLKTNHKIGWISLKYLDHKYKLLDNFSYTNQDFEQLPLEKDCYRNMWAAIFNFILFQSYIWDMKFIHAEQMLRPSNLLETADRCLLLCHGAVCMELARQGTGPQFLSLARNSLTKAQKSFLTPLPIVCALLAQAEGSLGSKLQWEKYIRAEWFSWPTDMRPAELYFQMHLIGKQPKTASNFHAHIELLQTPERWVLRAIHLNPSCVRYWKALQYLRE